MSDNNVKTSLNYNNEPLDQWMPDKNLQLQVGAWLNISRDDITKEVMKNISIIGVTGSIPYNKEGYAYSFTCVNDWTGIEYAVNAAHFVYAKMTKEEIVQTVLPQAILPNITNVSVIAGQQDPEGTAEIISAWFPNVIYITPLPSMHYTSYSDVITLTQDSYTDFVVPFSAFVTGEIGTNGENPQNYSDVYLYGNEVSLNVRDLVLKYGLSLEGNAVRFTLLEPLTHPWVVDEKYVYCLLAGATNHMPASTSDAIEQGNFLSINSRGYVLNGTGQSCYYTFMSMPILRVKFS